MAYSVDDIGQVEAWTHTGYDGDDIQLDEDNTVCMTNGTPSEDCDEIKDSPGMRVEINVPPATITALKVRFYLNSIMTAGNQWLMPHTSAVAVSIMNEVIGDYTTAGVWVEHVCSPAFIAELADLGDKCAVRLASFDQSAKSKLGEVEVDVTWDQPQLSGITKDNNGDVLVSCKVSLFKVISEGPPTEYEFKESQISDGVTGAYSFGVYEGNKYMIYAEKDDTPHVFDATDNVLEADV